MGTFNGFPNQLSAECNAELRNEIGVVFNSNTLTSDSVVVTGNNGAFKISLVVQD